MPVWRALFISLLTSFATGAAAQSELMQQFRLDRRLVEISGLAVADSRSLWAHDDEHGIVYRISLETGELLEAFALGDPSIRDDFEGVAIAGGKIYLINSTGRIYEAPIGEHGHRVRFNTYDTGLDKTCEVEGLAEFDADHFLIICKTPKTPELTGRLTIYQWSLSARAPVTAPWLSLKYDSLLPSDLASTFFPSALAYDAASDTVFILSARNRVLLRLHRATGEAAIDRLEPARHFQPEGIALLGDGRYAIADEGALRLPGRLSIYRQD